MGKGKYNVSPKAVCPHYRSEQRTKEGAKIRCDGVTGGTWLHLEFESMESMISWRNAHCKRCFDTCPIARMLDRG